MIGGSSSARGIQRVFLKVSSASTASEASTDDLDNMFDLVQEHDKPISHKKRKLSLCKKNTSLFNGKDNDEKSNDEEDDSNGDESVEFIGLLS